MPRQLPPLNALRAFDAAGRLVRSFHELQPVGPRMSFALARALVPLFLQLSLGLNRPGPWISADLDARGVKRTALGLTGPSTTAVDGYQEVAVKGTDAFWHTFFARTVASAADRGVERVRRVSRVLFVTRACQGPCYRPACRPYSNGRCRV